MVIEKVGSIALFIVLLSRNASSTLWVLIIASNITNIIRNIVRIIIRIVGRINIVKTIIKPKSTKLEREDKYFFTSFEETLLEGVACRGGVEILVIVFGIGGTGVGPSLCFNVETVQ